MSVSQAPSRTGCSGWRLVASDARSANGSALRKVGKDVTRCWSMCLHVENHSVGLIEMADAKMMRYFGVCVKLHAARSTLVQPARGVRP
jgi:hypothetical protein